VLVWPSFAGAVVAALVAQAAPVPSPAAPSSPLPEIAHTRTSAFCSALRENIGPAVGGLVVNDKIVERSKRVLARMSVDEKMHADTNFDRIYLESLINSIGHNLTVIGRLTSDAARFPQDPKTPSERETVQMQAQVREVAGAQQAQLNVIDGVFETQAMGSFQNKPVYNPLTAPPTPAAGTAGSTASKDLFDAGIPAAPSDAARPEASADPALIYGGLYGPFVLSIAQSQVRMQAPEADLARSVPSAAITCGAPAAASPAPP
jgi:hypothetical protein